jgi:DNA-binding MarR family transcriptional regulator
MYSHSRRMMRRCGLTIPQAIAVQILLRTDGICASELARQAVITPGTMSGILDRLEDKGLAVRIRNPEDRRIVMVHATNRATRLFENDLELLSAGFPEQLSGLSEDEQENLLDALRWLAVIIEDPGIDNRHAGIHLCEPVDRRNDESYARGHE